MLKPKEFLYFYRILNWKNKISGIRPIGYTLFAYLMTGLLHPKLFIFNSIGKIFIFNLLAVFGALIFLYSVNDYFDWKLQKEENFLGLKIENKNLKEWQVLIFCFLPLLFLGFLIPVQKQSLNSICLFIIFFIIAFFYSLPPVRLKTKKIIGIFIPSTGAALLFLQGYLIFRFITFKIIALSVILFFLQLYFEMLHILEDSFSKKEIKKMKTEDSLKIIKTLPIFTFFLSLAFAIFISPVFLITSFFSIIRFLFLRNFTVDKVKKARRNLFSPRWSLYEFLIYSIFGTLHLFF